jgi:uncharacterized protein
MATVAHTPDDRPTIPAPPALEGLLKLIENRIQPIEIWLFGSRARGEHRPDSDWDVLAVVSDDAAVDVDDPVLAWRIARESGVPSTLLMTRKADLDGVWGRVNTLGYDLAREGLRINVR